MSELRLRRRAERRGWSKDKLNAKLEKRDRIKARAKNIAVGALDVAIKPIADVVLNTVPFGGLAAKVLDKASVGVLEKVPAAGQVIEAGAAQFDEKVKSNGGVINAIMADAVPVLEYIENGEYGKAVLGICLLAAVIGAAVVL